MDESRGRIKNVLLYARWATAYDPYFRLRYVLRDEGDYKRLRDAALSSGPPRLTEYSEEFWMYVGLEWWKNPTGTAHGLKGEITREYKKWRERGSPPPPERCISDAMIGSMMKFGMFWGERAGWGDDVEGYARYVTGGVIKG